MLGPRHNPTPLRPALDWVAERFAKALVFEAEEAANSEADD